MHATRALRAACLSLSVFLPVPAYCGAPPTCVDTGSGCANLLAMGKCNDASYIAYTQENCAQTCFFPPCTTPAPATPAPETAAPSTPAPLTPAPATPAPLTPAPATPAPLTPAPATPAPLTPAPATPAPLTPAPLTSSPPTPAPLTATPCTPAPGTPTPPTPRPPTPAPPNPTTLVPRLAPTGSPSPPSPEPSEPRAAPDDDDGGGGGGVGVVVVVLAAVLGAAVACCAVLAVLYWRTSRKKAGAGANMNSAMHEVPKVDLLFTPDAPPVAASVLEDLTHQFVCPPPAAPPPRDTRARPFTRPAPAGRKLHALPARDPAPEPHPQPAPAAPAPILCEGGASGMYAFNAADADDGSDGAEALAAPLPNRPPALSRRGSSRRPPMLKPATPLTPKPATPLTALQPPRTASCGDSSSPPAARPAAAFLKPTADGGADMFARGVSDPAPGTPLTPLTAPSLRSRTLTLASSAGTAPFKGGPSFLNTPSSGRPAAPLSLQNAALDRVPAVRPPPVSNDLSDL